MMEFIYLRNDVFLPEGRPLLPEKEALEKITDFISFLFLLVT